MIVVRTGLLGRKTRGRLHRAAVLTSTFSAMASVEVLSLDDQQSRPEDTLKVLHDGFKMSNFAGKAAANLGADSFKRFCIDSKIAVPSFSVVSPSQANQIKSCKRNGINHIAFSPATGGKVCRLNNFIKVLESLVGAENG